MEKKYRSEIKYRCTEQDFALIESRISHICQRDAHAREGIYAVRSVYFDDYHNTYFYENEDGVTPREKFRIRMYNADTEHIVLERKRKDNSRNRKDSCPLTREQCQAILDGSFSWAVLEQGSYREEQRSLIQNFFVKYSGSLLRPKVIVAYERTPFVYGTGNVRITFDRNIAGCAEVADFLKPDIVVRPVMPVGEHILEVKYDELLPDFLYNAMQLGHLRQTAYSKYYICRKFCG